MAVAAAATEWVRKKHLNAEMLRTNLGGGCDDDDYDENGNEHYNDDGDNDVRSYDDSNYDNNHNNIYNIRGKGNINENYYNYIDDNCKNFNTNDYRNTAITVMTAATSMTMTAAATTTTSTSPSIVISTAAATATLVMATTALHQ